MIFDTHAHYDDNKFDTDRHELLMGLAGQNIGNVVNVGADIESSRRSLELSRKYPFIYAAVGVHPSDTDCLNEESFAWLKEHMNDEKVVAVGEIGLDYYWEKDADVRQKQSYWFKRQFDMAASVKKPVIIHSRDAAADTWDILNELDAVRTHVVIHCYSYSPEMARKFLELDTWFGIGGVLTFKNGKKLRETVPVIPLNRLLLETDCPYLAPEPHRGERNHSGYLGCVVSELSGILNMSEDEIIRITEENAREFYGL